MKTKTRLLFLFTLIMLSVFFVYKSHSEQGPGKFDKDLKSIKEDPLRKRGTLNLMNVFTTAERRMFFEATDLYQKKLYQKAIEKLKLFIDTYSKARLVEDAYFLIGDCHYNIAKETDYSQLKRR